MIINQLYIKVLPTSSIDREARRVGSKLEKAPSDDGAFFIADFSMCYNSILLLCFTLQCTFFRECTPKSVHNEAHRRLQLQKTTSKTPTIRHPNQIPGVLSTSLFPCFEYQHGDDASTADVPSKARISHRLYPKAALL